MLAVTRPENRQRAETAEAPLATLVAVPTTRGTYFVPGDFASVRALLHQERLGADDLLPAHRDFQPLLRHLFMLATQEALCPGTGRTIRNLVRALRRT